MSWIKEHIVEVILGVAGLVGASSIIALANDVTSIITDKPYAVMAVVFCGVVIGVLVCYLSGLKEYRIEKLRIEHQDAVIEREKQEAEEKSKHAEEEKKRNRVSGLINQYKNLAFMQKVFLYVVYIQGAHDVPSSGYIDFQYLSIHDFVDTETIEDGTRYTLKEEVKDIFKAHPEILKTADAYCNREFGSMMP